MATLSLTRRVTFTAAHRYRRADWTDARNAEVFGGGPLQDFHSHAYVCDVTVSGPLDESTGMIVDLRRLDRALASEVVERFDGRNLNLDIPEFGEGRQIPTGENLARLIAARLQHTLSEGGSAAVVTAVTVAEDPMLSATWRAASASVVAAIVTRRRG
jgi:6-pyruvoyltetrahydropterin/6-carboxytetrahydropterin synthase